MASLSEEPTSKKIKLTETLPQLKRVSVEECKRVSDELNHALEQIHKGGRDLVGEQSFYSVIDNLTKREFFCLVKIVDANSSWPCSFTNVWCVDKRNLGEENENISKKVANYDDLFNVDLLKAMKDFQPENHGDGNCLNVDKMQLFAVRRLANFLTSVKETTEILLEERNKNNTDVHWTAVFGTHVLRKLSISGGMLTSDSGYPPICQCPCGCNSSITIGDTSMGNLDVWHGSVDIIMGDVAILNVHDIDLIQTEEDQSSCEATIGSFETDRSQIIAQTIVFSFVQKKGLVPTIVFSKQYVKFFMYDTDNDLLFEGTQLKLFCVEKEKEVLDLTAIVAIWLVLNYCQFCTGPKPAHIAFGYTADFFKFVKDSTMAQKYSNECHLGNCKFGKRRKLELCATGFAWDKIE